MSVIQDNDITIGKSRWFFRFIKGTTTKCNICRTLALISQTIKILLHIINNREYWHIPQEQILNICQLIEKSKLFIKSLVLCFINSTKAFEYVVWSNFWLIMRELGVLEYLVAVIAFYRSNQGFVKFEHHLRNLSVSEKVLDKAVSSRLFFLMRMKSSSKHIIRTCMRRLECESHYRWV